MASFSGNGVSRSGEMREGREWKKKSRKARPKKKTVRSNLRRKLLWLKLSILIDLFWMCLSVNEWNKSQKHQTKSNLLLWNLNPTTTLVCVFFFLVLLLLMLTDTECWNAEMECFLSK